jgi:hypothetical protein
MPSGGPEPVHGLVRGPELLIIWAQAKARRNCYTGLDCYSGSPGTLQYTRTVLGISTVQLP